MKIATIFTLCVLFLTVVTACDEKVDQSGTCGDGIVDVGEECDSTIPATESCQSRGYYGGTLRCSESCTFDLTECVAAGSCNDGVLQQDEACDGEHLDSKTCATASEGQYASGTLACDSLCQFDFSGCTVATCGNNTIEPGEECEGFDLNNTTCADLGYHRGTLACGDDCHFDLVGCEGFGRCGDAQINKPYEECEGINHDGLACEDFGYYGGELYCTDQCQFDLNQCEGECGDGVLQTGLPGMESCDGAELGGATCESLGYYGGSLTCTVQCSLDTTDCATFGRCGDGTVDGGQEDCDGASFGGATCESMGYYGGTLACTGQCGFDTTDCVTYGYCGDGVVQSSHEVCDGAPPSGETCMDNGFRGGTISCGSDCQVSTSTCTDPLFTNLSTALAHSCALDQEGRAWCWGNNTYGQLGDGSRSLSATPVAVAGEHTFVEISAGGYYTCALTGSGDAWCWGKGGPHLGAGTMNDQLTPVAVSGGFSF